MKTKKLVFSLGVISSVSIPFIAASCNNNREKMETELKDLKAELNYVNEIKKSKLFNDTNNYSELNKILNAWLGDKVFLGGTEITTTDPSDPYNKANWTYASLNSEVHFKFNNNDYNQFNVIKPLEYANNIANGTQLKTLENFYAAKLFLAKQIQKFENVLTQGYTYENAKYYSELSETALKSKDPAQIENNKLIIQMYKMNVAANYFFTLLTEMNDTGTNSVKKLLAKPKKSTVEQKKYDDARQNLEAQHTVVNSYTNTTPIKDLIKGAIKLYDLYSVLKPLVK